MVFDAGFGAWYLLVSDTQSAAKLHKGKVAKSIKAVLFIVHPPLMVLEFHIVDKHNAIGCGFVAALCFLISPISTAYGHTAVVVFILYVCIA